MPVGALPAFNSTVGFGVGNLDGTANVSAGENPTVAVGDVIMICVAFVGGSNRTLNSISPRAWQIQNAGASGAAIQVGIAWRTVETTAESTESPSLNLTGTSTTRVIANARLTAADGFDAIALQAFSSVQTATAATSVTMPTVDITGINQRAFALVVTNVNAAINAATGESGGNWINTTYANNGSFGPHAIVLQTSDQSGGGDISGGTATWTGSGSAFAVGFAAVPDQGGVVFTKPFLFKPS
jgi:hypothetical protein